MCAPSVLITFINMMLNTPPDNKSHNDVSPTNSTEISQTHLCEPYMFDGQAELQDTFKYLALICIPILLCGKPLYIYITRSKAKKSSSQLVNIPGNRILNYFRSKFFQIIQRKNVH